MEKNMDNLQDLSKEELIAIIVTLTKKVADLEKRLNQNSSNSSKPPSSDGLSKPATKSLHKKSGKKPGGQKGHKGHGLKIEKEADEVVLIEPMVCPECKQSLSGIYTYHADTRYVYEAIIDVRLIKYDIRGVTCSNCGAEVIATPPKACKGRVNYGNSIRSLCVVLTNYANVSIDKAHKILKDLLGVPISTGTIKNVISQFAGKTEEMIAKIKENLLQSPILHVDETGMRVAGRTQWVHVASNAKYTLICVHKSRGKMGSEAGGVLSAYTGTLIHDCWKPYFGFDKCEHALCCAHLLRELNGLIESGQLWAADMKALLLEMKEVVDRYKGKNKTALSRYYKDKFELRYYEILEKAEAEITPSETRKKTNAENLLKRFEDYQDEIIRFTGDFEIPFDNNQAERDIRNVKVKQKVSGGFRTEKGAEEFGKISSVIGTAVKLGKSVVDTIRGALDRNLSITHTLTE